MGKTGDVLLRVPQVGAIARSNSKLQPLVVKWCFATSNGSVFAGNKLCNQTRVIKRNFDACVSTVLIYPDDNLS